MSVLNSYWKDIRTYFRDILDCYTTAMKGLHVTAKVMTMKPVTAEYPEQSTGVTLQYRGFHDFDSEKCNGCGICAKRCPVECIAVEKVGKGKDAQVARYAIDYTKCLFCSLCCEACPHDAVTMGSKWYREASSRDDCLMEFEITSPPPVEDAESNPVASAVSTSAMPKESGTATPSDGATG